MATNALPAIMLGAGEVLIWRVLGSSTADAESIVRKMGDLADLHNLGDWDVGPMGIGNLWWFELILAKDADAVHITLLFDGMPDGRY